jgi:hypothetical protein
MANVSIFSAPIKDPIIEVDRSGKTDGFIKKTWIFFFNQVVDGDNGSDWTPIATNLSGSYTLTGKYFRNAGFIDFWINVDPITSSTSTLGTTFIELPFDASVATSCTAVYGSTVAQGIIDPSLNRLFPPSWGAVASVVTISGRVFTK